MAETDGQILAKRWEEWLISPEGQRCAGSSAYGQYLENRLWRAFMAGAAAPSLPSVELAAKIKLILGNWDHADGCPAYASDDLSKCDCWHSEVAALSSDKVSKEVERG